jgi:hypothetical protein
MTDDGIDRDGLPDRWDGDVFEDGCRVYPEPGPKVGIHWGHLLMLEKYLRDIQDGLDGVLKADAWANPDLEPGEYTDVCFKASMTLNLTRWLESQIRGLRTDEWPEDEHDQTDQAPPENNPRRRLEELFPFMRDDPDIPF